VKSIVRLHGGTVSAHSEKGLGTTVIITFPAQSGHAENKDPSRSLIA